MTDKETLAQLNGGMKFDGGKAKMDLVFDGMPNALSGLGEVLTFGAKKYAAHSWRTVPEGKSRYKAAAIRHLIAHAKGEAKDPESGLPHLYHAFCNIGFMIELDIEESE